MRGANFIPYEHSSGITSSQLYSTASYQAHDLTGINLGSSGNLAGANLGGQNLTNARFDYTNLANANLSQANLTNSYLTYTNLTGADLTGANLTGADVSGASFSGTGVSLAQIYSTGSYQSGYLYGIGLANADLSGANFANKDLFGANLAGANLSQANLRNAQLTYATLTGANLTGAEVRGASFDRWYVLRVLRRHYRGATLFDRQLPSPRSDRNWFGGQQSDGRQPRRPEPHECKLRGRRPDRREPERGRRARCELSISPRSTGANTSNLIQSNGHIAGLDLTAGASLVVRDYDGNPTVYATPTGPLPIVVDQHLAMDATGTLRLVFDADALGFDDLLRRAFP